MDYFVKAYKDWKLHSQFQEIVPDMDDEYMFNEKKSIRESGRSLKKYGSTAFNNMRNNETLIRHDVDKTDTLQGIALKYGCTTEQIRRANRLFAQDSLFLRQFLLIPVEKTSPFCIQPEIETVDAIYNYSSNIFDTAAPTTTTSTTTFTTTNETSNNSADNLPSMQQQQQQSSQQQSSQQQSSQQQQLPARPYSIAGDLLLVNESDEETGLNKYGSCSNSKQSKSLDSVVTITPEEENRRCINEFLNKIDTTISESRKYVERSKEMITSQSDNDLFVATNFVHRRNQNINLSYKQNQQNHQRQSSTGSASDTVHLLNTTQTRRVQNTLKLPQKQQQDELFEL